jgi:hypothetical protein
VSRFESNPRAAVLAFGRIGRFAVICSVVALSLPAMLGCQLARAEESHAIAMHGSPAVPADFTHLPYFNADAPKGGRLVWGLLGTFDSLNPMIVRGIPVQQIRSYGFERGYTIESLMASPSISIPAHAFRTARRYWPKTYYFPGSCYATTVGPTIASIIPRSPRRRRSIG